MRGLLLLPAHPMPCPPLPARARHYRQSVLPASPRQKPRACQKFPEKASSLSGDFRAAFSQALPRKLKGGLSWVPAVLGAYLSHSSELQVWPSPLAAWSRSSGGGLKCAICRCCVQSWGGAGLAPLLVPQMTEGTGHLSPEPNCLGCPRAVACLPAGGGGLGLQLWQKPQF